MGSELAEELIQRRSKNGSNQAALVVTLQGDLGTGKTTFVQGFLRGLGLKKRAQSPTFIIMRRHALKRSKFKNVFHVDAYRLKSARHLAALGFREILSDPQNIVLIEWPERAKGILPASAVRVAFRHGKTEHLRTIIIKK